ncbi:hypothetical protein VSDG_05455 [Cytospora chrysosperma]|uniref:Bacteriophage T5 Orf172 DNA-binding domain-containing protein n=1 Tax=Cytospora chrysosperma TaxID=252740 RepID=A0A423VZD2_CYTCH|nr:hypothetical protein VSDG_05455 [Valsa sordida]
MPRPQQVDAAVFTAWLLDLFLSPQFSDIDELPSDDHFTSAAPVDQENSHDGQSSTRDRDVQDHPAGQTRETQNTGTDHSPPYANTRSHRHHHGGSDGGSPPPVRPVAARSFDRYGPPMTAREINEGVKRVLLAHLPATEGYVYGFTHPEDMTMSSTPAEASTCRNRLIKIGRSVNYERRMREFRRNCKYLPRVVFAHLMPHHLRIEMVVHLQLHNVRLREAGCTGCGARHEEWFGVDVGYAERLVSLWQGFANCQPYDEGGEMLPMWRERLEEVDMNDEDCWERFMRGVPSGHPVVGDSQGIEEHHSTPCEDEVGSSSDELSQTDIP